MRQKTKLLTLITVGAAVLGAAEARAQVTFTDQDLLLNFRQQVGSTPSTFDVTVDLGNVNTFLNTYAQPGSGTTDLNALGLFNPAWLTSSTGNNAGYGNLNNVFFDAVADNNTIGVKDLWATRLRGPTDGVATPWNRASAIVQGGAATKINTVGANAGNSAFAQAIAAPGTPAGFMGAARTTDQSANGYNTISAGGTFNNFFVPTTEGGTGASFTSQVYLDFFAVPHGSGPGTWEGTFILDPSGDLTFTAVPEPSAYGLVAGLGLLALAMRSGLRRVQA
jgi:hypothetical protein